MLSESERTATASRVFQASADQLFDAWLDPAAIGRWMFGPAIRDEQIVRLTTSARLGGDFSFVIRRQGEEIDHIGRYLTLDRPHRLAFSWGIAPESPDESVVSITITPGDEGTRLELGHLMPAEWVDFVPQAAAAWAEMLASLAAFLGARADPA